MTDSPVSPCPGSLAVAGELQFRNLHYTLPRGAYIVIPHPHQSQELLTSDFNKPYPDQDCPEESLLFSTKF